MAQINFGQVPPLPDFPPSGLLQWFVDADDSYGLTFDDSAGLKGFTVRWYADLDAPSTALPTDPTPADPDWSPLEVDAPTGLAFTPGPCLPGWDELPASVRADPVWSELSLADGHGDGVYAEDPDGQESYDRLVWSADDLLGGYALGSKLGGFASFVQADPRGSRAYPGADTPAGRLILELDASQMGGWGDAGIGHLFGDPAALGRGDLSSVRFHWDCG